MPWAKDENGNIAVDENGDPIYIESDDKQYGFKATDTLENIRKLVDEKKERNLRLTQAEEREKTLQSERDKLQKQLQDINGLLSVVQPEPAPEGSTDADDTQVQSVQERWTTALKQAEAQIREQVAGEVTETVTGLEKKFGDAVNRILRNDFDTSPYFASVADGVDPITAFTPDMAHKLWGDRFVWSEEHGKHVAYREDGTPIDSATSPGSPASFQEAIKTFIDEDPNSSRYLYDRGSANTQETPKVAPQNFKINKKQLKRSDMNPVEKADFVAKYGFEKWTELPA